ncbi:hypothetical protein DL93DRAFT_2165416 [Clavulina sp. PMI_390]|nr:hypothetical protein DL93DRAFT_2165416 [Clavulina sp. PMI_390]
MTLITLYGITNGAISSAVALLSLLGNQLGLTNISINVALWSSPLAIVVVLANLHLRSTLRALDSYDQSIPVPSFSLHVVGRAPRSGQGTHQSISHRTHQSSITHSSMKGASAPRTGPEARDCLIGVPDADVDDTILIEPQDSAEDSLAGPSCRQGYYRHEERPTRALSTETG